MPWYFALPLNTPVWVFWRPEAIFWSTSFNSDLHLNGSPLRNIPGLLSRAGNAMHCCCRLHGSFRLRWWNEATFTEHLITELSKTSYKTWVLNTCREVFSRVSTINLDLLAEFQSLYLSSCDSFSYRDLHPPSSLAAATWHFLAWFSSSCGLPRARFNSTMKCAFGRNGRWC